MLLLISALVVAVVLGYAIGGRLRNLESFRLRLWGLAIGGLLLQLVPFPESFPDWAALAALFVSFVMLIAFGLLNRRRGGLPIILFGLCLNGLVIGVNQGMPVTREALVNSGQADLLDYLIQHGGAKHHLATHDDRLLFLGDVIGVPKPIGQAISVGDVFVYVGMIWAIAAAMRARSPEKERVPPRVAEGQPPPPMSPSPPADRSAATKPGRPPRS